MIHFGMFFPLMKVLDLQGFLELSYLPPNNWENRIRGQLNLYAIWSDGASWKTNLHSRLEYGETHRVTTNSIDPESLKTGLCLFYPTTEKLSSSLELLPSAPYWHSNTPDWRATSGLFNEFAQTSYQAELYPLPSEASMMTFHPFIQFSAAANFLVVLNVVKEPELRSNELELLNSVDLKRYGKTTIWTNSASVVPLDKYGFLPHDLPLFLSRTMAGIPFGLGVAKNGSMLSLEHTHPPASLVLFGNRRAMQSRIKKHWLERIEKAL